MDAQPVARTWICERDDQDPATPFCARLLVGDVAVGSGRGVDEVTAYAALVDALTRAGITDGRVLAMQELMRR